MATSKFRGFSSLLRGNSNFDNISDKIIGGTERRKRDGEGEREREAKVRQSSHLNNERERAKEGIARLFIIFSLSPSSVSLPSFLLLPTCLIKQNEEDNPSFPSLSLLSSLSRALSLFLCLLSSISRTANSLFV